MLIIIINVVVFVLELSLQKFANFDLNNYFALSPDLLKRGWIWQLLTFQVLHGGWLHLLFNCWAIYMFGRDVEDSLGVGRFLTLYLGSGLVGGLAQCIFGWIWPHVYGGSVVGASAGAFGLIAGYATLYPERPLMLLLFFIIPVSMRAKFLLLFEGVVAVLGIVFATDPRAPGDHIAHVAHLGGMLCGIFFVRYAFNWAWRWPAFNFQRRASKARLVKVPSGQARAWHSEEVEELSQDDLLSQQVDPILDKISAQGIQSLTERERRILEAARNRMAKR